MNYQRDSNCLSPAERKRLAKLLGLLGSDHAGEVLSAAKHAHDLVQAHGLTWDQVISEPQTADHDARETSQLTGWRLTGDRCLRHADMLSDWEFKFLSSLSGSGYSHPTAKQDAVLIKIAGRVLGGQL
jgi:hypothetical protein